jgi:hypothetical protein
VLRLSYVLRQSLLSLVLAFGLATLCSAAELRTYTLADNQARLFHFVGGLLGTDVDASLSGSFDVVVEPDGQSRITRFDLSLVDILDQSLHPISWSEGTPLDEKLFAVPQGLTGTLTGTELVLGEPAFIVLLEPVLDDPNTTIPILVPAGKPTTLISISHRDDGLAEIRFGSDTGYQLDAPSMFTGPNGFLAYVVPEPAATASLLGGVVALLFARCHRRRLAPHPHRRRPTSTANRVDR